MMVGRCLPGWLWVIAFASSVLTVSCARNGFDAAEPVGDGGALDRPLAPSCSNKLRDPGESDVDCGGESCAPCAAGKRCDKDADCVSKKCRSERCLDPCHVWRLGTSALLNDATVDAQGQFFAVGRLNNFGVLLKLDGCGQTVERTLVGDDNLMDVALRGVAVAGSTVWVVGDATPQNGSRTSGYIARYDTSLQRTSTIAPLEATAGDDRLVAVTTTADGSALVAGIQDFRTTNQRGWALLQSRDGEQPSCEILLDPGQQQAVRSLGSQVLFIGSSGTEAWVTRLPLQSCFLDAPCGCPGTSTPPAPWELRYTHPDSGANKARDALIVELEESKPYLFTVGFWNTVADGADTGAFVIRTNLTSPDEQKVFSWKPTGRIDSFSAVVADAQGLYLAASRGSTFAGTSTGGTPVVKALDFDLSPRWEATVGVEGEGALHDIELIGADGLLLVGHNHAEGLIARCTRDGVCP